MAHQSGLYITSHLGSYFCNSRKTCWWTCTRTSMASTSIKWVDLSSLAVWNVTNIAIEHGDSFMDTPRLSTLQGMLIVLKARESAPKRGYYFRSWMTVVQCVQMAKDLGLDEHYEEHKAGRPCGSDPADCITKTRIWQTIFIVELMVGSPQGKLDVTPPRPMCFNWLFQVGLICLSKWIH